MRTFTAFAALSLIATVALAAPHNKQATNTESNAFSGSGGDSHGGTVENNSHPSDEHLHSSGLMGLMGGSLLQMGANNAGNGGQSNSGVSGAGAGGKGAGVDNSYTGVGGNSTGGSVKNAMPALIQLGSGNAGSGGGSQSGDSKSR